MAELIIENSTRFRSSPSHPIRAHSGNNTASSSIGSDHCEWSFSPDDNADFFIFSNGLEGKGALSINRSDISPFTLGHRNDASLSDATPLSFRPIFPLVPPTRKSELSSMLEASGYSSADAPQADITNPSPISVISGPSPCPLRPLQRKETERFFPSCSERSAPIAIPWQNPKTQHADKDKNSRHQSNLF